ncbi:MAG: tRNA (adenosine(37)-N6)-threonylcarbamoyltransferase complex ATPase subunit type 1 TsaE [Bacteroidaceae bacterium]|nr:tRNA (adenosine(37)-N6)-threonylcarbamoyltransferase complex ATPase subunit type 1 TsaE [Bacteroidaceae bacterium]
MNGHIIKVRGLEDYPRAAKELTGFLDKGNIFAFYGKMGSGKTTLIKSICEELGVEDTINSPTFAIVNEYEDRSRRTIFHFDFYRIKSIAEVYNMGYEEYIYSNALCFMEWPELIEELLPEDCIKVYIEEDIDGSRTIRIVEE